MPADKISLDLAKSNKLFYFVANVVVYHASDSRCLILKRSENEMVHPNTWGVLGGKLEWEDFDISKPSRIKGDVLDYENAIENLLAREVKEEAGITIDLKLHFINDVFFVRQDGIPVVLVKFAAHYKNEKVVPESGAFTDFAWVNAEEVRSYSCIQGIPQEIEQTIKLFA